MLRIPRVPKDAAHLWVMGKPELQDRDVELDNWIADLTSKGVPFEVYWTDETGTKRAIYKHTTSVSGDHIVPCCDQFDEKAEGRDLDYERYLYGFISLESYKARARAKGASIKGKAWIL